MPKVLSADAVRRFHEDGFHSPVQVLTPDEVAHFRGCLESFEARHPGDTKKLKTKAHLLCPWVNDIAHHKKILDVFEDLIGPDILCYSMAFRVKAADGKTFAGWHQDTAYAPIKPIMVIGALALSECGVDQGCLSVIPGTHKQGIFPHVETADPDSILARGQYIAADFDKSNAVDLALRPGEIGLFDAGIIHGSRPNISRERRIMLLVEMMPTCVEQRLHRDSALLVRGVDTYHTYDPEPEPRVEFGPDEVAAWQSVVQKRAQNVFVGSGLPVSEAYGGQNARKT